ncbi:GPAN1 protein, partial [Hypocryptadius cinnamomeus]|nr:GPAN1 protein [Hypocryptadius cinnamomeus]
SGSVLGSGPGYRLLLRAGWAGGGLGPEGRGRLLPVPAEPKRDRAGLGWGRNRERNRERNRDQNRERNRERNRHPHRARLGSEEAARGWEIRLREYMERWDPPERP